MKKLISLISLLFIIGLSNINAQCCGSLASKCSEQEKKDCKEAEQKSDIQVYYFYGNRRCATCQAVEEVAKKTIKDHFPEKAQFIGINREEKKNKALVERYKITGQTLIIIKGDQQKDLTNVAFMNARTRPEKLDEKIQATIKSMI